VLFVLGKGVESVVPENFMSEASSDFRVRIQVGCGKTDGRSARVIYSGNAPGFGFAKSSIE
jgi:hypothetical protein